MYFKLNLRFPWNAWNLLITINVGAKCDKRIYYFESGFLSTLHNVCTNRVFVIKWWNISDKWSFLVIQVLQVLPSSTSFFFLIRVSIKSHVASTHWEPSSKFILQMKSKHLIAMGTVLAQTEPNRTGLLVPKKINGLVWFGFSINSSISKIRVYRFGLKVYRFLVNFFLP